MRADARRRPRTKPSDERRDDLMNAAERLFLAQGIEPTTIDQITAAADVAKGTFYLYFESKEDVLVALRRRFENNFLDAVESAVKRRRRDDWHGKLRSWVKAAVQEYFDAIALHDLIFHQSSVRKREKLRDNRVITHLADTLAAGAAAKAWSIRRPREVAVFLSYGLHGIMDLALVSENPLNKRQLMQSGAQLASRIVGIDAD